MAPLDGEERLTSAITATLPVLSAVSNGGAASSEAQSFSRAALSPARTRARSVAAATNSPSTPVGGSHFLPACVSVALRLILEFGKCSVPVTSPVRLQPAREVFYVANEAPTRDPDLPRRIFRGKWLCSELRGDRSEV